jgi:hypothetical protein
MNRRQAIDLALDLARMPALARASVALPLPADVVELMRIAARSPKACQEAVARTGESTHVLVEAARFYLQQLLFRPDADCYRILGIEPGASRATARTHMRLLLQWLHPDRNSGLEAVYAERVLKAWREVSLVSDAAEPVKRAYAAAGARERGTASFRLPWIKHPVPEPVGQGYYRSVAAWFIPAGLVIIFLALWSAIHLFGGETTAAATIRLP